MTDPSDSAPPADWHQQPVDRVVGTLTTDAATGLSSAEAAERLDRYGPNELIERGTKSPWKILLEQFTSTLVVVLIVAAIISAILGAMEELAIGSFKEAIAIMTIVVLNALLGFRQEYRAEKAMAALKRMTVPVVKVRRDGKLCELSARELVPGDVVLLDAGAAAPADGRLIEVANLRMQEAALTGESEPVEKQAARELESDTALADRTNMVYLGTNATFGRGTIVVTGTGMDTELGKIAGLMQSVESEPTPLQRRLAGLGRTLAIAALAIVVVIFALGMLGGGELKEMFLTAVSMAVAAVPEGLPAVVTICLALGAQRMLKRQALIRKLPAVETLGSVTVICSDKTGTLTRNEMTVTVLDVAGKQVPLPDADGDSTSHPELGDDAAGAIRLLLLGTALCNDAVLEDGDGSAAGRLVGDPTETALVAAAARGGIRQAELAEAIPRVAEVPFESERKRMTTVHSPRDGNQQPVVALARKLLARHDRDGSDRESATGGGESAEASERLAFTKGSVDGLLDIAPRVWVDERIEPLTQEWRERVQQSHDRLAEQGMRVLGLAFRPVSAALAASADALERDMVFVGLIGMIDPPRSEAKAAVGTCRDAGIRPVMITGDHPLTARQIAGQLGIDTAAGVVTGQELDKLSAEELSETAARVSVYARVSPQHKLELVEALQQRGEVVAMTGDGVNDAPALKQADIGVAMGITGTDVSKEAADAVLRDDNFATIVAAVREGRIVYDNLRKFIKYTMTSNTGEILVMLMAPLLLMDLPLLPLQILWINLVTDGLPGLALAVEPAERDTMKRAPFPPNEHVFARGMGWDILWIGAVMGAVSLGAGYFYWTPETPDDPYWRTVVFTVLTLSQMGNAMAIRSQRDSLFRIGLFSNPAMLGSVLLTFVLQLALIYVPWLQGIFDTAPLSGLDLLICLALSGVVFVAVELQKLWLRR